MTESCRCTQCGGELPGDAPQGLCPKCLLAAGFASEGGSRLGASAACDDTMEAKFTPPTPEELAEFFPELEIIELLGRGGMGVVYKARQKRLDRLVALKILAPRIGQDPAFAERFAREARAMAMLSHANIVAVYDFGQTSMGGSRIGAGGSGNASPTTPESRIPSPQPPLYYFLMEYVDGLNLRQLLDDGKLRPEEALAIVPQICEALQYAHDHGVVHRDIKPENILLDKRGQVKIADFGIAKLVGVEDSSRHMPCAVSSSSASDADDGTRRVPATNLTAAGQIVGTPQYMAPEQIESPQTVDHRVDIYSLGVVFYQMLTGELPTGRFAPPSKKVQIDVRLDEVVLRAMEKEPRRRYQQASEIKNRVETIVTTPREGATDMPASRRRDWRAWVMGVGVRDGKKVINWPGLILGWPLVFAGCCAFMLLIPERETHLLTFLIFAATSAVVAAFFAWVQSHRSIEQLPVLDSPQPRNPQAEIDNSDVEQARQQVHGSAVGLLVTGILNWVTTPLVLFYIVSVKSDNLVPTVGLIPALVLNLVFSSLMIFAALKMKRLQAYYFAVGAGIAAILVTPGNVIGLPIGIWALVVLSQREVRAVFERKRSVGYMKHASPESSSSGRADGAIHGTNWLIHESLHGYTTTTPVEKTIAVVAFVLCCFVVPGIVGAVDNHLKLEMKQILSWILLGESIAFVLGILARKSRVGKAAAIISAAVVLFILGSLLYQWILSSEPRLQWQVATTPVGPAIDRVLIEGQQATIEGEASRDSRIMFAAGGGYQSCGFKKKGRFTATVMVAIWRAGLDIRVVDADGNLLLTSHTDGLGTTHFPPDRVIFGNSPLQPEPDGSIQIAEIQRQNGKRLPLTVSLRANGQTMPDVADESSRGGGQPIMTSLTKAVRAFNFRAVGDPVGKDQPPLTADEVIAVIESALQNPDKNLSQVSEETLQALKDMLDSRQLPKGFELEVISRFIPDGKIEVTRWSVRLRIPIEMDEPTGNTTCVVIRNKLIGSRTLSEEEQKQLRSHRGLSSTIEPLIYPPQPAEAAKPATPADHAPPPPPNVKIVPDGPLQVSPPPKGWKLTYDGSKGIDFYSVMLPEGRGVLMFSKWPPPSKPEDISKLVRQIADGFVKKAQESSKFALQSDKYEIEEFSGDHCKGSCVVFGLKKPADNKVQAMFMMSVDGETWNGQFTGKADDWQESLKLLKTVKSRDAD